MSKQRTVEGSLLRNSLLLSLFLHLLLLSSAVLVWQGQMVPLKQPKLPSMYVPSYAYQAPASTPAYESNPPTPKTVPVEKTAPSDSVATGQAQIRNASRAQTSASTQVAEAIHLVGDKKTAPKPLIKILGRALAAKLVYPKIAVDFRVHGVAYVGFSLHPDGLVTDVQLVQSSSAGVLDEEAVAAVTAMSPVKNVNTYVDKPRYLVVGIIFD